jgi:AraC-like DNA-binding protein
MQSGRYSVGEVAERVGYRGQAAFAAAFQRKFHVAPSRLGRGEPLAPLPPHGRPPRVDRVGPVRASRRRRGR